MHLKGLEPTGKGQSGPTPNLDQVPAGQAMYAGHLDTTHYLGVS
jgi:hypothetical protein